jgi:hypothetical protein
MCNIDKTGCLTAGFCFLASSRHPCRRKVRGAISIRQFTRYHSPNASSGFFPCAIGRNIMLHVTFDWHAFAVMLGQILAALMAGGLIGLERSYHGRAAGFRTFSLVALGACLLMVATANQLDW